MMLEKLQRRNSSAITTRNYLRVVSAFARHFGKSSDLLGPNESRKSLDFHCTVRVTVVVECCVDPDVPETVMV
jgi:hypothetical protein